MQRLHANAKLTPAARRLLIDRVREFGWRVSEAAEAAGVILVQPGWGTYGALVRQIWSFAGDSDRGDVSQLLLQPFVNFNLASGWYLVSDMGWTANWKATSGNRWTLPVGGGAGKIFKLGGQAMNARVESYYNAVRPDGAPTRTIGFTVQFLFPK